MTLMIRGIQVLAIPAAREDNRRADPLGAILRRQLRGIFPIAGSKPLAVAQTSVADGGLVGVFLHHGVAGDHAETGFEGRHFAVHRAVRHVVDGHAAVLLEADVGELGDALEGGVFGGAKVEGGGPVVGEVLVRQGIECLSGG